MRRILDTTIDTLVEPDSATEQVGSQTIELSAVDAKAIQDRVQRHPLFLIASVARGDTTFRLLSIRRHAGRLLAVLEREEAGSTRLRMHVDSESGLVRVIESTEQRPGIGATALTEEFRDYRNVKGGLRVPFLVTQRIEGTQFGSLTRWQIFEPGRPPEVCFDRTVELPANLQAAARALVELANPR